MKQAKQIFWNALLLSAATLLMKSIGVSFGVYLTNRVGAQTMGLFSLMGGVYGFALTLATSGIQLGVTKLTVEAIGRGEECRVRTIMRTATCCAALFGIGAMLLLFCTAPIAGSRWLKDPRTILPLRLFGITLPFLALSSVWNGYFTAVRRTYKTAVAQVLEQGIKIAATVFLLTLLLPRGTEGACCALILGGACAEIFSFLLNLVLYAFDRKIHFRSIPKNSPGREWGALLSITVPIALTAYLRSGLLTLQHILIPEGLRKSGVSHTAALAAYGAVHSMALPVILYPAALISSFSCLLIPALAESQVRKERTRIAYMTGRVWWLSLLFSIGVSGILGCFSQELGELLYPDSDAGNYIRLLAPLIPIMYLDTATDAMLKGLGEQLYSMKINIADAAISVLLVSILIPKCGITGYLVTVYISEFFNTVFSVTRLLCITGVKPHLLKWIYKPLLSIVIATACIRNGLVQWFPTTGSVSAVILHCTAALLCYLLLLLLTKSIDTDDLQWVASLFRSNPEKRRYRHAVPIRKGSASDG